MYEYRQKGAHFCWPKGSTAAFPVTQSTEKNFVKKFWGGCTRAMTITVWCILFKLLFK